MLDACLRQLAARGEPGLAGADDRDGYRSLVHERIFT